MADARLSVSFAGPLVTVQDTGRAGNMRYGVSASGPMDRLALGAANAALGNPLEQTGIEVSLGGLQLKCQSGDVTLAISGGDFAVQYTGQKLSSWVVLTLRQGEQLAVRAGPSGSWAYIAFAGQLDAKSWLGSAATHSPSGFGGGAVTIGQDLTVHNASVRDDRLGAILQPGFLNTGPIEAVVGPQDGMFNELAVQKLFEGNFEVSGSYDRMGMRLNGPSLDLTGGLSIPSEPIVRGAIQVSGDGVPTVLLADHQTTGGYPKIATVVGHETDRLSQFRTGDQVKFAAVTAEQAVKSARSYIEDRDRYFAQLAVPTGTLEERLMRENLISGWFAG